ncbi:Peptidase M20 family and Peptidase M20, dimerization domain-containing protein [Aphelenchoides bicaudatus]|nr:Peptidase M20 family and Peptidase M20, dimerization domain-containing protein [Aphelenchoides bicaudatus]
MSAQDVLAKNSVADFLIELMKIDSTTGKEGQLAAAIKKHFEHENWNVLAQPLSKDSSRVNLLITRTANSKPKVIFNTHLDTVPPYLSPVRHENGRISGRGSNDAKGQIAAMSFALKRLSQDHPKLAEQVGLLLVVGEETDHVGMIEANELDIRPEYLIVGEPTETRFGHAQKGALKLRLDAKGKAAHSGYPEKGLSAIHKLLDVLSVIRTEQWPKNAELGETTLNVGLIQGGQALNALADNASASLMFRVVDSAEQILQRVQNIAKASGIDVHVLGINEPVILSKPPKPYDSYTVAFNTDIPYYKRKDELKGVYLFGGGSITNAHGDDEHILIEELEKAVDVHVDLVTKLLANSS